MKGGTVSIALEPVHGHEEFLLGWVSFCCSKCPNVVSWIFPICDWYSINICIIKCTLILIGIGVCQKCFWSSILICNDSSTHSGVGNSMRGVVGWVYGCVELPSTCTNWWLYLSPTVWTLLARIRHVEVGNAHPISITAIAASILIHRAIDLLRLITYIQPVVTRWVSVINVCTWITGKPIKLWINTVTKHLYDFWMKLSPISLWKACSTPVFPYCHIVRLCYIDLSYCNAKIQKKQCKHCSMEYLVLWRHSLLYQKL